jgi:hypothetical protein
VLLSQATDDFPDPLSADELVTLAETLEALAPAEFEQRLRDVRHDAGDRRRQELYDGGFGEPIWERSEDGRPPAVGSSSPRGPGGP